MEIPIAGVCWDLFGHFALPCWGSPVKENYVGKYNLTNSLVDVLDFTQSAHVAHFPQLRVHLNDRWGALVEYWYPVLNGLGVVILAPRSQCSMSEPLEEHLLRNIKVDDEIDFSESGLKMKGLIYTSRKSIDKKTLSLHQKVYLWLPGSDGLQ